MITIRYHDGQMTTEGLRLMADLEHESPAPVFAEQPLRRVGDVWMTQETYEAIRSEL